MVESFHTAARYRKARQAAPPDLGGRIRTNCFATRLSAAPYKLDWSDTRLVPYDHLAAYTLRGLLVKSWVGSPRRLTRFIKQTPLLWRLAVRVRAMLGRWTRPAQAASDDSE